MKFYLSGQRTFGNRGCEALVRSTVDLIRARHPEATFLVPSDNAKYDAALWPEHAAHGVTFVRSYYPFVGRLWTQATRLPIPTLKGASFPFPPPAELRQHLAAVDAVLAIGGDNYSLDYRIPVITQAVDAFAMNMGKPVFLWGASVGPFEREPAFKPAIARHLARMTRIFVREKNSFDYLTGTLGLRNVTLAADPAFSLQPQQVDATDFWPKGDGDVVGINFSPLVARREFSSEAASNDEIIRDIILALHARGKQVLLIPHVVEGNWNNDYNYMSGVLAAYDLHDKASIVPPSLNSCQLKEVISGLSILVAARTHATIAAFSSYVPTVSLSYSVKARGINQMVFGHTDHVISTKGLQAATVLGAIARAESDRTAIVEGLHKRIPEIQAQGRKMVNFLEEHLE